MSLTPGSRFGSYEVTARLGAGGMGEVYRARDPRLDRDVALKVLPTAFIEDPDRLARFQREAKVLASLNHPNIGHLYGLEEADGNRALVLELVEGPTLAELLARGSRLKASGGTSQPSVPSGERRTTARGDGAPRGLEKDDALAIARQIADALEAAHEQGVVHRDLKPANIKVRPDGTVKVLDFGLAKAFQGDASGVDPSVSSSPTKSLTAATRLGMVIGTAAYMAPEQARGKPVDRRADVWAFGAVLYEMLTGRKAFSGDDISDTLVSVLRDEPDWGALPEDTPASVKQTLRVCLRKDAKSRLRDMSAVRLALEGAFDSTIGADAAAAATTVAPLKVWQRPVPLALAALALVLVSSLAVWLVMRLDPAPPADVVRFTIVPPETTPVDLPGAGPDLALSPDGRTIVFQSRGEGRRFYVQSTDQLSSAPLHGTENAAVPFFSPDGQWVGFTDVSNIRTLRKVPIYGGPPITVAASSNAITGATWAEDGRIVFGTAGSGLFVVADGGGEAAALTTLEVERGETGHLFPSMIRGRNAVLFTIARSGGSPLQNGEIAAVDLAGGSVTRLGITGVGPRYIPTGHVVYGAEDGSLRGVPFDVAPLDVTGSPVPLVEGVVVKSSGAANFAISDNGRLIYVSGEFGAAALVSTLVWVDRAGREEPAGTPPRRYFTPRLSPDGTRIAVDARDEGDDIWVWDIARGALSRLTSQSGPNRTPVWSADGSRIAFSGGSDTERGIFWQAADGSGTPEALVENVVPAVMPRAFSPDGRELLVTEGSSPRDVHRIVLGGSGTIEPVLASAFNEHSPEISPDGRWMAYESDESGRTEVYVRPYPDAASARFPVSTDGGIWPLWSRNGRELFYWRRPDTLMVVPVEAGSTFRAGRPVSLVQGEFDTGNESRMYDVTPDGRRFLFVKPIGSADDDVRSPAITVVLNWFEDVKARFPTR
jgi:serine/threonine-protein kinase